MNATKRRQPLRASVFGCEKRTVPIKPGKPPNWQKLLSYMMVTNPLVTRSSLATTTTPNPIKMCCQEFELEHLPGQLPFSQLLAVLFASDKLRSRLDIQTAINTNANNKVYSKKSKETNGWSANNERY